MNDSAETASFDAVGDDAGQPVAGSAGASWSAAPPAPGAAAAEHPEMLVAGAFAGGLLLATILKRLAG
jgi:hypothetical protein